MATLRQIEANRRNAQRSTGPKSETGKAAVCLNRLKHGLRAETIVLPEESHEKFDALCERLSARYLPEDIEEEHLVELMAIQWWRAARTGRMIDAIFADGRAMGPRSLKTETTAEPPVVNATFYQRLREGLRDITIIEQRYDRSYEKARKELERLQTERKKQEQLAEPEPLPEPEVALPDPAPEPCGARTFARRVVTFDDARPAANPPGDSQSTPAVAPAPDPPPAS